MGKKKRRKFWLQTKPEINKHHRLARSLGGREFTKSGRKNIVLVTVVEHEAFNTLFGGSPTPLRIANILNTVWIDTDYELIVRKKEE